MSLLNEKLEMKMNVGELDHFHRIGRRGDGKIRPVVVKFVNQWRKIEMLKSTSKLKGSKISISQDLTMEEEAERKRLIPEMIQKRNEGFYAVMRGCRLVVLDKKPGEPTEQSKLKRNENKEEGTNLLESQTNHNIKGTYNKKDGNQLSNGTKRLSSFTDEPTLEKAKEKQLKKLKNLAHSPSRRFGTNRSEQQTLDMYGLRKKENKAEKSEVQDGKETRITQVLEKDAEKKSAENRDAASKREVQEKSH